MDAPKDADRSKHYGHISGKNKGADCGERRDESRNHATWRIRSQRRIYAMRMRRKKSARFA